MVIVGGSMLLAAAAILTGREMGVLTSAFAGAAMMIFEIVEVAGIDRMGGKRAGVCCCPAGFLLRARPLDLCAELLPLDDRVRRNSHFPSRHVRHA